MYTVIITIGCQLKLYDNVLVVAPAHLK